MARFTKRKAVYGVLGLIAVWVMGNLGYRWVVAWRVHQHEKTISWTSDGVHPAGLPHVHGSGATAVLLVHGINDTPEVWDRLAPELAEKNVFVSAMRLPGFGESTERYGAFSRHQWVDAVAEELSALNTNHDRVILVGHSLGGAVSIATARLHSDKLDALVLLAPAVAVSDDRSPLLPTRTWHSLSYYLAPLVTITESPFAPNALDPESRNMKSRGRFVPRHVVDELFLLLDENWDNRRSIRAPTLVVVAADDQVISNDAAKALAESLEPPAKYVVQEGCAHMIQRDYQWREVTEIVGQWIRELEQTSESTES